MMTESFVAVTANYSYMWLLKCLFVLTVSGQVSVISMNGYQRPIPLTPPFNYSQGGADWGPTCHSTSQQQSPVDINQHPNNTDLYQEVNQDNSVFVPLVVSNAPIGNNFIPIDVSGTTNFHVLAGELSWKFTAISPSTQVLIEFHVVAPAEHTINGHQYPLEVHLHYGLPRPAGLLMMVAVVAIWFDVGEENPVIGQIIEGGNFDLRPLFPDSGVLDDYFYYTGTEDRPYPYCIGDIAWTIPNYVLTASQEQIDYFNNMYMNNATFAGGRGNNRAVNSPTQPVYHFSNTRQTTLSFLSL